MTLPARLAHNAPRSWRGRFSMFGTSARAFRRWLLLAVTVAVVLVSGHPLAAAGESRPTGTCTTPYAPQQHPPKLPAFPLQSIHMLSPTFGWASDLNGLVMTTVDAGRHWAYVVPSSSPTNPPSNSCIRQ